MNNEELPKEYKTNFNEKSLENLRPGNKLGNRHKITKRFVEAETDYLIEQRDYFHQRMMELSAKDFCAMYLAMMKQILPKNIHVETNEITKEIKWEIIRASTATPTPTITPAEYDENESDD